ncbi:hypothetical protein [Ralstonia pseudosolanacearum]
MNTPMRGWLLQRDGDNGPELWRYLAADRERQLLFVLAVDQSTSTRSSRTPTAWKYSDYLAGWGTTIRKVDECVKTPEMEVEEGGLPDAIKAKQGILGPLIADCFDEVVIHPDRRSELIADQARLTGKQPSRIRVLLTRFWWFGCDAGALMNLNPRKGAPGVSRVGQAKKKVGRKNAYESLYADGRDVGVNVSRRHLSTFRRALDLYWVGAGMSLAATYRSMSENLFVGFNRLDGEVVAYPMRASKVPTEAQFRYHAQRLITNEGLRELRDANEVNDRRRSQVGNASDLCRGVLTIFDLDGTEFPIELVSDDADRRPIGRPVVLFGSDRGSSAIVGLHVWLGTESSRAYRYCIYNALSSKAAVLEDFGLEGLEGLVSGNCDLVYLDRGPGIAEPLTDALIKEMHLGRATARPGRGADKGGVEGVNRITKEMLANLDGAYFENESKRSRARARHARANASLTLREFLKELYKVVSRYNTDSDAIDHYTAEMRREGVAPHPKDIFDWNQSQRRGDAAVSWTDREIYERLLDVQPATLNRKGVRFASATYTSARAGAFLQANLKKGHSSIRIEVIPVPSSNRVLVWKEPDGKYSLLVMTRQDQARLGGSGWVQHKNANRFDAAKRSERSRRNRRKPGTVVPRRRADLLADAMNITKTLKKTRPKTGVVKDARRQELGRQLQQHGDERLSMLGLDTEFQGLVDQAAAANRVMMVDDADDSFDGYAE